MQTVPRSPGDWLVSHRLPADRAGARDSRRSLGREETCCGGIIREREEIHTNESGKAKMSHIKAGSMGKMMMNLFHQENELTLTSMQFYMN